jgi:molecular chaperone Hsp33
MQERDTLRSFLFEHFAIRGEVVHLDATWREVLKRHDYPPPLRTLLGEMMAATALLAATLKFTGSLSLQIQGNGPVTLGVVECTDGGLLRGLLKWRGEVAAGSLAELVGDGRLVITLEQRDSGERYQGIVELVGTDLAQALRHYLLRSEQLDTHLWLAIDDACAAGMLLQRMPAQQPDEDADAWPRAVQLADTISRDELLQLDAEGIIHRLFHEEDVRLFEGRPLAFRCSCSRERVVNTLQMLGREEVHGIIAEQGEVAVNCEFCNQGYVFDAVDVGALFTELPAAEAPKTRH